MRLQSILYIFFYPSNTVRRRIFSKMFFHRRGRDRSRDAYYKTRQTSTGSPCSVEVKLNRFALKTEALQIYVWSICKRLTNEIGTVGR